MKLIGEGQTLDQAPKDVPVWQSITPDAPTKSRDQNPRSRVYTEEKIIGDYRMYCKGQQFFDLTKTLEQKQRDLFRLYEERLPFPGEEGPVMGDVVQAWEWVLAKARGEWGLADYNKAIDHTRDSDDKGKLVGLLAGWRSDRVDQGLPAGMYRDH